MLTGHRGMQTCFRKYPEVYGAELADDEDAQPSLDANADASVVPPTHAAEKKEVQKEAEAGSPDPAPRAEIKNEHEVKKVEIKPEAETKKMETKKAKKVESVDLTKPNTAATDATAANDN